MMRLGSRGHNTRLATVLVALLVALGTPITSGTAANSAPATATFAGKVRDSLGKALVNPMCLYLWSPAGSDWTRSNSCIELDSGGSFNALVSVGSYKIEVAADNIADNTFVGGANVQTATVVTISEVGLKGVTYSVPALPTVSGTVTGASKVALVNASCVSFWVLDSQASLGWSPLQTCGEISTKNAFVAYVPVGTYKLQITADNVDSDTFVGGDGTLAKATVFTVPSAGLAKVALVTATLPAFSGKVTMLDGSVPQFPNGVNFWTPDSADPDGWSLSPAFADLDSKGAFTAYVAPGTYVLEFAYGKPRKRFVYGGATPSEGLPIAITAKGAAGQVFKIGYAGPPPAPTDVLAAGRKASILVAWTNVASATPATATTAVAAIAQPGGAFCQSTTTTCTITGLKDGTAYSISVRAFNGTASVGVNAGTIIAGAVPQTLTPDTTWASVGDTVGVNIANAQSNTSVTISAKPGGTSAAVKTNGIGGARAFVKFGSAGAVVLSLKTSAGTTNTTVWVPGVSWTTKVKASLPAKLAVLGVPASTQMRVEFSDGTPAITGTADSKGTFSASPVWKSPTTVTATVFAAGRNIGSAVISVTQ
ncbi:MAG: hypothetical protein EBU85_04105 [Actinobacteria bacterium]|nr:hypothetical protein [Actinomycetota bacterium]